MKGKFRGEVSKNAKRISGLFFMVAFAGFAILLFNVIAGTIMVIVGFFVSLCLKDASESGKYSADDEGVSFKKHSRNYRFDYSEIAGAETEILLGSKKDGVIVYAQLTIDLKNGDIFEVADRIGTASRYGAKTLDFSEPLAKSKLTKLKDYITERIA